MPDANSKICERCGKKPARPGYRFCGSCSAILLREMEAKNYLTKVPPLGANWRGPGAEENTYETKHGVD